MKKPLGTPRSKVRLPPPPPTLAGMPLPVFLRRAASLTNREEMSDPSVISGWCTALLPSRGNGLWVVYGMPVHRVRVPWVAARSAGIPRG